MSQRGFFAVVALGIAVVAAVAGVAGCGPAKASGVAVQPAAESWCPSGFEGGQEDTCFALPPEANRAKAPILIYLHGALDPNASAAALEPVRAALAKGYAVVLPHGKRSLCSLAKDAADKHCWPETGDDVDEMKRLVKSWESVIFQVEAMLEGGPHKHYVLGSDGGGSFAVHLATHGVFPAAAYGIIGGGPPTPSVKQGQSSAPVVLIGQEGDSGYSEWHKSLEGAAWGHARCARAFPGPLTTGDVDAALRFFERERAGELASAMKAGKEFPCDGAPPKPKAKPDAKAEKPAEKAP